MKSEGGSMGWAGPCMLHGTNLISLCFIIISDIAKPICWGDANPIWLNGIKKRLEQRERAKMMWCNCKKNQNGLRVGILAFVRLSIEGGKTKAMGMCRSSCFLSVSGTCDSGRCQGHLQQVCLQVQTVCGGQCCRTGLKLMKMKCYRKTWHIYMRKGFSFSQRQTHDGPGSNLLSYCMTWSTGILFQRTALDIIISYYNWLLLVMMMMMTNVFSTS